MTFDRQALFGGSAAFSSGIASRPVRDGDREIAFALISIMFGLAQENRFLSLNRVIRQFGSDTPLTLGLHPQILGRVNGFERPGP